ncbi:MAG: ATP-grasp domain-containing protein, partial [Gammaproteobacteria bacterium]
MNIALLHEHPSWSTSLIQAFASRGIALEVIDVGSLNWDCRATADFDLAINRVNVMPSAGRPTSVAAHTQHYLHWLEQQGVRVINGARAHFVGCSKAAQSALFNQLGLSTPRAVAINHPEQALAVSAQIGFPCIVKPNLGGSGAGIARYQQPEELALAIKTRQLDLGLDGTGLVQENIPSADGFVYRLEILGGELFYAIRQPIQEGAFNYCAADGCSTGGEKTIEPFSPSAEIVKSAIECIRAAGADLGGVEYLIHAETGEPCFYDFNPYSNFVADGETLQAHRVTVLENL